MKKHLFIAGLAFSTSFGATAQQPVPASAGPATAQRADTVRAVRDMFSRHRTGGWIWTAVGAAFAVRIVSAAAGTDNASGAAGGALLMGGVPAGIGVGKLVRFSQEREATVVSAYEQRKTLPKYVSRRLKRKYFGQ